MAKFFRFFVATKRRKIWFSILGGFLLLIAVIILTVSLYLKTYIENAFNQSNDGLYTLKIEGVWLNPFTLSGSIKGVSIVGDSLKLKKSDSKIEYLNIEASSISFRDFSYYDLRNRNQIVVSELLLDKPDIVLSVNNHKTTLKKDSLKSAQQIDGNQQMISAIDIANFVINDAKVDLTNSTKGKVHISHFAKMDMIVDTLLLNLNSDSGGMVLEKGSVKIEIEDLRQSLKEATLQVAKLKVDTKSTDIEIERLELIPDYSKYQFPFKSSNHDDYSYLVVDSIFIANLDIKTLVATQDIVIDAINITGIHIDSYKDWNAPLSKLEKLLPYKSLHQFEKHLKIGNIDFKNLNLQYEEKGKGKRVSGHLTIDNLSGTVTGIDNRSVDKFIIEAQGKLMKRANFSTKVVMPNDKKSDSFEMSCRVGPTPLDIFNPMVEPLAYARISRGNLKEMSFVMRANSYKSNIEMKMIYDSLHAKVLKEEDGKLVNDEFLSAAGSMFYYQSNPVKNGVVRVGIGTSQRDKYKSTFYYVWHTTLSGIKTSVLNSQLLYTKQERQLNKRKSSKK